MSIKTSLTLVHQTDILLPGQIKKGKIIECVCLLFRKEVRADFKATPWFDVLLRRISFLSIQCRLVAFHFSDYRQPRPSINSAIACARLGVTDTLYYNVTGIDKILYRLNTIAYGMSELVLFGARQRYNN